MIHRHTLITAVLALAAFFSANAQERTLADWQSPGIYEINRLPMHASVRSDVPTLSLDGVWQFRWFDSFVDAWGLNSDFAAPDFDDSA